MTIHPSTTSSTIGTAFNPAIEVKSATPNTNQLRKDKSERRYALIALSICLTVALGCIALIIGAAEANAASMPTFTVANALTAKQDPQLGWAASGSLAAIAVGTIFALTRKPGRKS